MDPINPADRVLERGMKALRTLLGDGWAVTEGRGHYSEGYGAFYDLKPLGENVTALLYVEDFHSVTPRTVETQLAPRAHLLRHLVTEAHMVVVAPWISTKAQQLLLSHGIAYLDLTGNVGLRISRPAVFIHSVGASRSPHPTSRTTKTTATLAGAKAGRLVRLLADVRPPYRAAELANAASLSLPYVSRLLDTLEDQLLIRRTGRVINTVDWPGLLRARAAETSLLRPDAYTGMVATNGIASVLNRISRLPARERDGLAVTGSVAAHRLAPLTARGQLMVYVADWLAIDEDLEDQLGLLPTKENADVILLRPSDEVVFERLREVDARQEVSLSQLVLDCLSGPGRMPAEGEAVIKEMLRDEGEWRASAIADLRRSSLF
ncbi:helix-turn-helix domain-containing protein [Streptomyces sp. NPDC001523]|uniref:helix-turn-helix domain-containing protein n=1 Tax=Streptomyces sp. NPDC001523 TaxID=3154383 RepID=UPI003329DA47